MSRERGNEALLCSSCYMNNAKAVLDCLTAIFEPPARYRPTLRNPRVDTLFTGLYTNYARSGEVRAGLCLLLSGSSATTFTHKGMHT